MASDLREGDQESVRVVLYLSSGLSGIAAFFIIFTYLCFKDCRTFGTRLIFFLSLCDFFLSAAWFPWNFTFELCDLQAMMIQFFLCSSYLWSLMISVSIYQVFVLDQLEEAGGWGLWARHGLCWGFPAATVILCLAFDKFGRAGAWCWIRNPQDPFRLLLYAPCVVVLVVIVYVYCAVRCRAMGLRSEFKRQLDRKLSLYALAFVVSQAPAFGNRIQNWVQPDHPMLALFLLQAATQPSQGLLNALVYGATEPQFLEAYAHAFGRLWRCLTLPRCCTRPKRGGRGRGESSAEEVPIVDYEYNSDDEG